MKTIFKFSCEAYDRYGLNFRKLLEKIFGELVALIKKDEFDKLN